MHDTQKNPPVGIVTATESEPAIPGILVPSGPVKTQGHGSRNNGVATT